MKSTVSNKISNLRPGERQPTPPSVGRKRRVNTGARVLAVSTTVHACVCSFHDCDVIVRVSYACECLPVTLPLRGFQWTLTNIFCLKRVIWKHGTMLPYCHSRKKQRYTFTMCLPCFVV